MRIAQFIDTESQGGAERVVIDLGRHLRDLGHEVLTLHFGSAHLSRECSRYGLAERIVPAHRYYKKTATLPRFAWSFQGFLRSEGVDVLHSHLLGPVTGAAPAARLAGIPHVGTLHDVYSVAEKPQRIRLVQLAALLGTRLTAVSRHMEHYYRSQAHFPGASLRTVYNGVQLPKVQTDRQQLRRRLGLDPERPLVVGVGRLVALKRHDLLLQAFARLAADTPAQLLIVGDGPLRERLERQIQDLGLDGRVMLVGARNDVPELLAASDLFTLCSDTEGLSCSILEAMASGLAVVATDVGGNNELVADGESGLLVPAGDAAALAAALGRLLSDAELRRRYGERAQRLADTRFSMTANLQQYLELYQARRGMAA